MKVILLRRFSRGEFILAAVKNKPKLLYISTLHFRKTLKKHLKISFYSLNIEAKAVDHHDLNRLKPVYNEDYAFKSLFQESKD